MAQITILPGIVQQFDVATEGEITSLQTQITTLQNAVAELQNDRTALTERLDRLETVVAQNSIDLLNIPLDGEDMTFWLGKINTSEERLYNRMTSDFPVWLLSLGINIDPQTGRAVFSGQILVNMQGSAGMVTLSTSPRLASAVQPPKQVEADGFFEFDWITEPNTTYYVSVTVPNVGTYQRAIAYFATT